MQNNQESTTLSNLEGLIKQNRNADFRSIVSSIDQRHLVNIGGNTLMHTAVTRNNIEILLFLSGSGFNINAQNLLGQTPLHLAVLNKQFQAVQLLLSIDADIFVEDNEGMSALQLSFQECNQVPEYIITNFFERLKRTNLSNQQIANELNKSGCTINQVLLMNNAVITSLLLDQVTSIPRHESRALLERAMTSDYPDNVKALLRFGPELEERRNIFVEKVIAYKYEPNMNFFFKKLVTWKLITEELVRKVQNIFRYGNEREVQMYIDIGIHKYVRKKLGCELLVELLENNRVDRIKILKNNKFDVNSRNILGDSAIQVAVKVKSRQCLLYLLKNGADPNIRNCRGETPLMSCFEDELDALLLEYGADVQAIDKEGETIVDKYCSHRVVAELCILEAKESLKQELADAIENNMRGTLPYKLGIHREDLEWMKNRQVSKSITMFSVLVDDIKYTARHVKNKDMLEDILKMSRERALQPSYSAKLMKNLESLKMYERRDKAAKFLSKIMKICQSDHLIVEKIISFLNYRDLLVFDTMNVELLEFL